MPLPTTSDHEPRRLLRDDVFEAIKTAIVDGTLEPGETLRDDELMHWLGVSRTPVRQALNMLSDVGLVEMVPGRYTRVSLLDAAMLNQATYTTGIMHEYAARTAVPTMTDDDLAEVHALREQTVQALADGDVPSLSTSIGDFFLAFERATGNDVLVESVELLHPRLARFLAPREGFTDLTRIVRAVEAIDAATQERDADRVVSLLRELYAPTRAQFLERHRPELVGEE